MLVIVMKCLDAKIMPVLKMRWLSGNIYYERNAHVKAGRDFIVNNSNVCIYFIVQYEIAQDVLLCVQHCETNVRWSFNSEILT